jgi:hypothetical protein
MRAAIGMVLATGGLTFFVYGLQQAIENGSCGTSDSGVYYGPCPSGTGPMIVLMVFGMFAAIAGALIAGVILRFVGVIFIASIAGVVLGIVDVNPDDTRPGYESLAAVLVPIVLFVVPGLGRRRNNARLVPPQMREMAQQMAQAQQPQPAASFGAPPQWKPRETPPTTPADAEAVASRLRQLDQLKQSGLLGDAEYAERRKQILAEL